jgi:hypothetical protein
VPKQIMFSADDSIDEALDGNFLSSTIIDRSLPCSKSR